MSHSTYSEVMFVSPEKTSFGRSVKACPYRTLEIYDGQGIEKVGTILECLNRSIFISQE